jgi:hypothetical protein
MCPSYLGCGIFGRDEKGSEFSFTGKHIDALVLNWTDIMDAKTEHAATMAPDASRMVALDLCVSGEREPTLSPLWHCFTSS